MRDTTCSSRKALTIKGGKMQKKIGPFILVTLLASTGAAAEVPENYSLECWDGTFRYNRLTIKNRDENIHFESSSQAIEVYSSFLDLSPRPAWGDVRASFSLPKKDCVISSRDPKVITCNAERVDVGLTGYISTSEAPIALKESKQLESVFVQLRKVSEVSMFNDGVASYELLISTVNSNGATIILKQNFSNGPTADQTNKCKITQGRSL